jgi:hypothetical protein
LQKRQSTTEAASKKFDQTKALKLYYTFFIQEIGLAHMRNSPGLREFYVELREARI